MLVTIDEESYKRLEKRWPWGRDVFADFLNKLAVYKPKVIALDFALYGESPDNPEADTKLADAIKLCKGKVVWKGPPQKSNQSEKFISLTFSPFFSVIPNNS